MDLEETRPQIRLRANNSSQDELGYLQQSVRSIGALDKIEAQESYPQLISLLPLYPHLAGGSRPPKRHAPLELRDAPLHSASPEEYCGVHEGILSATTLSFLPITNFPFGLTFTPVRLREYNVNPAEGSYLIRTILQSLHPRWYAYDFSHLQARFSRYPLSG